MKKIAQQLRQVLADSAKMRKEAIRLMVQLDEIMGSQVGAINTSILT